MPIPIDSHNFSAYQEERITCAIYASVKYEIPANIMLAVAEKEGGKPGQYVANTNGTFDVGPMQFNTLYLKDLQKYGIKANHVAERGCYAYDLAAWRLRMHLKNDKGDIWTRASNYHSRTPTYNARYRTDLIEKAVKWATWLKSNYEIDSNQNKQPSPNVVAAINYVPRKIEFHE